MSSLRRLATFSIVLAAVTLTACVPAGRANARVAAVRDTLASSRAALARRDSVFMPLNFSTPDSFLVAFETTKGRFDVMAHRQWAPAGAGRFYELVHRRFYDSVIVFRVVKGFVAQFGISGDPAVSAAWRSKTLGDEPNLQSNTRGRISYARSGMGTRTTQLFINYGDNSRLDRTTQVLIPGGGNPPRVDTTTLGYPPFAEVMKGMEVVDSLYADYGGAPSNRQGEIQQQGNAFLRKEFPLLDMIKTARIIQEWRRPNP